MRRIRRITWVLCAIWIVAVLGFSVYKNITTTDRASYTATSDSITFSGYTYVSDNSNGSGVIYQLTPDGTTNKVYVTHRRKYISDWDVIQLTSQNSEVQVGGTFYALMRGKANDESYIPYRIVSFTSDMITEAMSVSFYLHSGLIVTGFSYDEGVLYITGLSKSRQDVYIYQYSDFDLIRLEGINSDKKADLAGTSIELSEVSTERNPSGLLYTEAEYADGTLYTRFDDQEAGEYFAEKTDVKSLFDNRTQNFFHSLKATGLSFVDIIAYCLIGSVIIILLFAFLSHRKRVVYRFMLIEGLVIVSCLILLSTSAVINQQAGVREFIRNEIYTLSLLGDNAPADLGTDDFFSSAEYSSFYSNLSAIADRSDDMADIRDIAVVDQTSGAIAMSLRGYGGGTVSYVYGEDARALCMGSDTTDYGVTKIDGEDMHIIAVNVSAQPQFKLLCVARLLNPAEYVRTYELPVVLLVLMLFIISTIVAVTLIYSEAGYFNRLTRAIEDLGAGKEEIEIPSNVIGYDVKRIWSGVNEIEKILKRTNREKFMTYEAYFRFAPKKIEQILGKDMITEVKIGDYKKLKGTVAIIQNGLTRELSEKSISSRNSFFSLVEKHSAATGGIFVASEANLSSIRMLFLDDNHGSIRFGADLARDAASIPSIPNPTIILHYASYIYGVAGTDTQALTFLSADSITGLGDYAGWLGSLGISMVVTDEVIERESGSWDFRFIGFVIPDKNNRSRHINLYEVLDATDGENRRGKKRTSEDFAKALELFYEKDFYFARNMFTDILREVPTDAVAKWYLFECERLLNESASPDFVGELHVE
ncbi:MAG: hypothetical protein K6B14_00055 [Lachnospiraceae bacterium]|nr:hypothetical protein [Lachnospiraceae bacterium]